jgi:hypothetical protein
MLYQNIHFFITGFICLFWFCVWTTKDVPNLISKMLFFFIAASSFFLLAKNLI